MRSWWLAWIGVVASTAAIAQTGDPQAGRELAEQWCTACHVVTPEGPGTDVAPALPELVREGRRTSEQLRVWLTAPHPPMPDLALTRRAIDDIVAYLETLAEP